jgi:hypothetical protein
MKHRRIVYLVVLLIATSGCAQSDTDQSVQATADQATADRASETLLADRLTEPGPPERAGFRPCLLATDCLTLDERPFQVCLLGAERCPQQADFHRVPAGDQR